jgi:hypothetical protein
MTTRRRLISFDWALKRLLRSKANFGILEGFLSELLRDDIRIVEILESETNKEDEDYVYVGRTTFHGLHKTDALTLSPQQQSLFPERSLAGELFPEYYLIKVNRFDDIARDRLDEWIYFLKHEEIAGL